MQLTTAKSLQPCLTLCDPIDGSLPGSPDPGILQARTLEWVAISFSNAWKWKVKVKSLSRVRLFATPWTAAYQAPPSMGFSRQEYWSEVPSSSSWLLLSHYEEWNKAICSNMDGPGDYYTKWNKSDKEKYHMVPFICRFLKKWYKWTYLQNRLTDLKNKLIITWREG